MVLPFEMAPIPLRGSAVPAPAPVLQRGPLRVRGHTPGLEFEKVGMGWGLGEGRESQIAQASLP